MHGTTEINADRLTAVTFGIESLRGSDATRLQIFPASDASAALRLVRSADADLLVTGLRVHGGSPWCLIRRLRIARPWQKWVLAADEMSQAEEVEARSLSVSAILGSAPDIETLLMLAESIRSARRRRDASEDADTRRKLTRRPFISAAAG